MITTNPPNWTLKIINNNYAKIKARAKQNNLPMPYTKVTELGVGGYGCVFSTEQKGIVFKITSDPTEAKFISILKHLEKARNFSLNGIVNYFGIYQITGLYRERLIYAIWREETKCFEDEILLENEMLKGIKNKHNQKLFNSFIENICDMLDSGQNIIESREEELEYGDEYSFLKLAQEELKKIRKKNTKLGYLGQDIESYIYWANKLFHNYFGHLIGESVLKLLSYKLILCDIRSDNIGLMLPYFRKDYYKNIPIIIDPGSLIMLTDKYSNIRPKKI